MNRRNFVTTLSAAGAALAQAPALAPDPTGNWAATLVTPAGKLRLTMNISKAADGLYIGALVSVDQGGARMPIDTIKLDGKKLHLELNRIAGVYDGILDTTSAKIEGTWTQGGPPLPLEFTRTAKTATEKTAESKPAAPKNFPMGLPLDLQVPIAPAPFPGKGKTHLVYELHLTNLSPVDLLLKRIEVLSGSTVAIAYEAGELNGILHRFGVTGDDQRLLEPGRRAVAFVWITLDNNALIPTELHHRITVGEQSLDGAPVTVSQTKPLVLSPPFTGKDWIALNGPGNGSVHRRAVIPINGRACISQRYAIDWARIGPNGKTYDGDAKVNSTHFAYGTEALAVADGTVVTVKDGIPENIPGPNSRAVPITLETIGGNHIILDLGEGCFGFYAHLQPGKIRVKVGDKVKRGQTLGLVGNSGNSTEPHLHFHVTNGNSPLGSEGVPYVFDKWHNELPMQNEIVTF